MSFINKKQLLGTIMIGSLLLASCGKQSSMRYSMHNTLLQPQGYTNYNGYSQQQPQYTYHTSLLDMPDTTWRSLPNAS